MFAGTKAKEANKWSPGKASRSRDPGEEDVKTFLRRIRKGLEVEEQEGSEKEKEQNDDDEEQEKWSKIAKNKRIGRRESWKD